MVCEKDFFNRLICLFSIKETFVSLSENIDLIELCYMLGNQSLFIQLITKERNLLGNVIALTSVDVKQIEGMKQPFIESLFNILDMCRQRRIVDEQNSKQTKTTSIWHPILGHIRGKTSVMTVFVSIPLIFSEKSSFRFIL